MLTDAELERAATKPEIIEALELLQLAKAGARPPASHYAEAPLLEDWSVVPARVPPAVAGMVALEGYALGHPDFDDGERIQTTPLVFAAHETGWARTLTRYYRLGRRRRIADA